jgi:quercetin dioxygenase-like cupin family protein
MSERELLRFVDELSARADLWQPLIRHATVARVFERVWDGPQANAWLICWNPGHDTGWHDHDDSAAAIAVLGGQLHEQRLRLAAGPAGRVFDTGSRVFVPASAIHRVRHAGTSPALSIHAYSPPLRRTGAYTIGPRGELRREAQPYDQELRAPALT